MQLEGTPMPKLVPTLERKSIDIIMAYLFRVTWLRLQVSSCWPRAFYSMTSQIIASREWYHAWQLHDGWWHVSRRAVPLCTYVAPPCLKRHLSKPWPNILPPPAMHGLNHPSKFVKVLGRWALESFSSLFCQYGSGYGIWRLAPTYTFIDCPQRVLPLT